MYAIIEDSGSQIKVGKGDVIQVDPRELKDKQTTLEFDKILLVGGADKPKIGEPYVKGAKVTADILGEERTDKITVIKFKRRKGYRRKQGHRQQYLKVKITDISP
ncbi:MAG: 50S ribosomal protein L21 [Phycisphaerae bacterium]|nr:50S ribosomal protein L21 [Phycisphaerae bacterium]